MSMLSQLMSQVMSAGSSGARQYSNPPERAKSNDTTGKENRAAWRKLYENAQTPEQKAALLKSAPAGVDLTPYQSLSGIKTPDQEASESLAKIFSTLTGQPAQSTQPAQPTQPQPSSEIYTPSQPATTPTPTPELQTPKNPQQIFTPEFMKRAAIKKYANIDVGAHYFEAPQWFAEYNEMRDSGIPPNQAMTDLATKYGFIPDGASNLKDISDAERDVIFNREFSAAFNDPTLSAVIQKMTPPGRDITKTKTGYILESFASQGRFIPDEYQRYLDRFRGLEDPSFVSDAIKTQVFQTTGIPLEQHDNPSAAITSAQRELDNHAIIQTAKQQAATTTARLAAESEFQSQKKITAEDQAKYGIGSTFPTYNDIAASGKRFPTEADRKIYAELEGVRTEMQNFETQLFDPKNGIFTGIGTDLGSRAAAKGKLIWERTQGSQRGQYLQLYQDTLASMARKLLSLAGESGGRFTDVDVRQIMRSAPDPGDGLLNAPDSQAVAKAKYDRFVVQLGERLGKMLNTVVLEPTEKQGADTIDPNSISDEAKALIQKYKGNQ